MRRKNKISEVSWGRSGRMAVDPPAQPQQQMNMNQQGQAARPAPTPPNTPGGGNGNGNGGNGNKPNSPQSPPNGTPQNPNQQPGNIDIATLKKQLRDQLGNEVSDEQISQILANQLSQQPGKKMEAIFRTLVDLDVLIEKKAIANIKKKFKAKDPHKK